MIKKFDEWGSINFVDGNNILIGYDMSAQCCENFGYKEECVLENSEFTGEFEEHLEFKYEDSAISFFTRDVETKEHNGQIIFYNSHNGYYNHGYEMLKDNEIITSGCL